MKIEKIHVNKIKVTFSPEELIEHNITPEAVRDNSPAVRKLLMNIVRQADEKVGFGTEDARLMIEAMPGEGDSMVMYITKLTTEEDRLGNLNAVKRKLRLKVHSENALGAKNLCITFNDFEDALKLSHFASDVSQGELYFFEERYHLIIEPCYANRFSEFGKASLDETLCGLIREHGKKICDDALKTLRENF